ncbi:zf-HC2 domain-containing protein [Streptomyces kaniharaensis]|uniref:Zf-HC2 domain-containing protein n=1 Tax=Streptomyces kaniharaensis TaxID=212423 RepID=A0A6N7KTE9_9ACTN|nr:zf-HC2 domain-containing protein [Streptomyces kaniharaensis]MQS14800.1 zf-HC2 domain-containing protein [Streptomyces kaniharaensis]
MNRSPACADLGAYVLGGLDGPETDGFEEHLLGCEQCLSEIGSFQSVRDLLLPLVGQPLEPAVAGESRTPVAGPPGDDLLHELLRDVARERHRATWRTVAALTAAAALLVALPFVALWSGSGRPVAGGPATSMPSPAAMLMMTGEQHTATDAVTGVTGAVGLEDKAWGTHVALQLSGVDGPLVCSLVAVSKSGEREPVTNWSVPSPGYGVAGHPDPLVVHGGTSLTRPQLDHFEVRTADGRRLVSVPV